MPPFTIHSLRAGDIGDVIRIAEECGLSPWSAGDYLDESKRNDSTLLRLENQSAEIVGFLVGRRVLSATSETHFDAEIYNIGVRTAYQRSGCGTILLNEFLSRCVAQLVETVWLDVRISNTHAIFFYRKFGFREFTIRSRFYSDPAEDGVVMKLSIPGSSL